MNIQQANLYSLLKFNKQMRRSYTSEENEFILNCYSIINCSNNKQKWEEIVKLFKIRFPNVYPERTAKNLLDHFEHSLDNSLKRGPFTIDEHEFILNCVSEKGNKWKTIGQILHRNENQIKNEFYRKLASRKSQQNNELEIRTGNSNFFDFKEEFEIDSNTFDDFTWSFHC
jgi:hypothetical protein